MSYDDTTIQEEDFWALLTLSHCSRWLGTDRKLLQRRAQSATRWEDAYESAAILCAQCKTRAGTLTGQRLDHLIARHFRRTLHSKWPPKTTKNLLKMSTKTEASSDGRSGSLKFDSSWVAGRHANKSLGSMSCSLFHMYIRWLAETLTVFKSVRWALKVPSWLCHEYIDYESECLSTSLAKVLNWNKKGFFCYFSSRSSYKKSTTCDDRNASLTVWSPFSWLKRPFYDRDATSKEEMRIENEEKFQPDLVRIVLRAFLSHVTSSFQLWHFPVTKAKKGKTTHVVYKNDITVAVEATSRMTTIPKRSSALHYSGHGF